ncbi:YqiJ family protein [Ferrimonas pelagia]|uniref:DUF1449 family protein n=1 Tax=Ferrimonas pelagia TaxID=1177826 RepID=A0ABP9F4R1_9GAMM
MLEFLFAEQNTPFIVALSLMGLIALFEGVASVLGFGISSAIDALLPEIDLAPDGLEVSGGVLTSVLGWLMIGKVPVLMILVLFLTLFGICGYILQYSLWQLTGWLAPGSLVAIPATLASLPLLRAANKQIARVFINDRSEAISLEQLIGSVGVITVGIAEVRSPAQARVKDKFGTQHYIMIEPDNEQWAFHQGESVLLTEFDGQNFKGIPPKSNHLQSME